jgi:glycosyltransferase involved in cell wall biosynthesis
MSKYMITTIITTYRRPQLLRRAIKSVLMQTYSDFQICVYDNASDDETEEMMQKFVKIDPRIKYHRHSENIGMMENYKYAFGQIDTSFFSLLSDDDYLLPCFYETALKGFEQFPDAAFSACGVAQVSEQGQLLGDPIASWPREGYYPAPEGLLEMVSQRRKFPTPTGVLFQRNIIRDVSPNFSKDVQLLWDPDYFIQIVSQFPCVISKKHCAVYCAFPNTFCSSFFSDMMNNIQNVDNYITTTSNVVGRLKTNNYLSFFVSRMAVLRYKKTIRQEVVFLIGMFIGFKKLGGAHFLAKKFYVCHGISPVVILSHFLVLLNYFFKLVAKCFHKWVDVMSRIFSKFEGLSIKTLFRISDSISIIEFKDKIDPSLDIKGSIDYGNEILIDK